MCCCCINKEFRPDTPTNQPYPNVGVLRYMQRNLGARFESTECVSQDKRNIKYVNTGRYEITAVIFLRQMTCN